MGMYGGGGQTVQYQSPQIQQDNTFAKYLASQQEREARAEERAAKEAADRRAEEKARQAAAEQSYGGLRSGVEAQLRQGLISYGDATGMLRDYAAKYNLTPKEDDVTALTNIYTKELLPGRRSTGISAAYEELLGRSATEEEIAKGMERFEQGYYSNVQDLKDSLVKGSEYQDKFNQSYLDNYYDTMFGKQSVDAEGKKTGQRTFKFDKNLLPSFAEAEGAETLQGRSQIKLPDFQDSITGTPGELQEQLQNIRDTRQYLYSAGLTNLQGEIDKETQKLKNEGIAEVQKIKAQGDIYTSLVGSFSF